MPHPQVTAKLGLDVTRLEPTRAGDEESLGNGNWHLWTGDGEHHILRRYHVLRTEEDLVFETRVLDHLTDRGWCVPARVAGPVWYDDRLWAVTRFVPGKPHRGETPEQRAERGAVLARLHEELHDLERTGPLSEDELAAIEPLQLVFRVLMVMAALWNGQRNGRFDMAEIDHQLGRIRS
ncbi:phosphotransferase [Kribbella sp. NPDC051952]|uniref:phosphotransferase enzyme family protein n=1 Tax=Kribbella sp. NPDC051952 TaxID=3154851 RepID=UPI003446AE41